MQRRITDVDFRGQFRLAKANNKKFSHWKIEKSNEWTLEYCPTLKITQLFDSEKQNIGCILGYAITPYGVLLRDSMNLPISTGTNTFNDLVERFISKLAGRYAAFIITDTITKKLFRSSRPVGGCLFLQKHDSRIFVVYNFGHV